MKTFIRENPLVTFGLCLFLALVFAALIISNGMTSAKRYDNEAISVTGAYSAFIDSDQAVWHSNVARRAATLKDAHEQLQGDIAIVRKYLLSEGFHESEIDISPETSETNYVRTAEGNNTDKINGFTVSESIGVQSKNVDLVTSVANNAFGLVNQGLTLSSETPQFFYSKLDSLKIDMLGKATANARARAEKMLSATGSSIGFMRSAQMGVFQITSPNSTDVSGEGISDTSSKRKKITAVVNASFSVR